MIDIAAAVKLANEVLYAQTMSRHRYDEKARAVAATVIAMAAALRSMANTLSLYEGGTSDADRMRKVMESRGLTDSGATGKDVTP